MKALAIHVGANRSFPGFRGPIRSDATFAYLPPPETDPAIGGPTYADLDPGPEVQIPEQHRKRPVHLDPEFPEYPYGQSYTYGVSATATAGALRELSAGDLLFFYATLDYAGEEEPAVDWVNPYWGAYLVGHFELARDPLTREEVLGLDPEGISPFDNNAHFRRPTFDAETLVLGHPERSQLYERAVPLSSPEDPSRPNPIVTELSSDSGEPGWHHRLLTFDGQATQRLLAGIENDDVASLVTPGTGGPHRGDPQAFLVIDEAPGERAFERFLALDEGLRELDTWIRHHLDASDDEARLFATVAFVAAGSTTRPLTALWQASVHDLDAAARLQEQTAKALAGALAEEPGSWPPPRRARLPEDTGEAAEAIAEALQAVHEHAGGPIRRLLADEAGPDPGTLVALLAGEVPTYDRVTALDQLRVWYRVLGCQQAGPRRLRLADLEAEEARGGFEAVFGLRPSEMADEEAQACLDALVDRVAARLVCSHADAVFRVERGLRAY